MTISDPCPTSQRRSRWRVACSLPFVWLVLAYRATLSPLMGGHCRFHPSCSAYALECYRRFGPIRASLLTLRRLGRCHPLGGSGYDPPPSG
ncbi:MAG: membrane protein insertion efficiency factor YidD [Phycisphaerales bacterium JB043]